MTRRHVERPARASAWQLASGTQSGQNPAMHRTNAEIRALVDPAQIALLIAFLVDLALPWWTRSDSNNPPTGTATGWGSLSGGSSGYAWGAIIAMAVVVLAAIIRARRLSVAGGLIGIVLALVLVAGADREHGFGPGVFDAQAGLWLGVVLIVLGGALSIIDGTILSDRHGS